MYPENSSVEILPPTVMVLGGEAGDDEAMPEGFWGVNILTRRQEALPPQDAPLKSTQNSSEQTRK